MRVRFTQTALAEIENVSSYVARDSRFAAAEVVGVIEATIARLIEYPQAAVATDVPGYASRSRLPHPYLIFYSIKVELQSSPRLLVLQPN